MSYELVRRNGMIEDQMRNQNTSGSPNANQLDQRRRSIQRHLPNNELGQTGNNLSAERTQEQILQMFKDNTGLSNGEIAEKLAASLQSSETHLKDCSFLVSEGSGNEMRWRLKTKSEIPDKERERLDTMREQIADTFEKHPDGLVLAAIRGKTGLTEENILQVFGILLQEKSIEAAASQNAETISQGQMSKDSGQIVYVYIERRLNKLLDKPLGSIKAIDYPGFKEYAEQRGFSPSPDLLLYNLLDYYITSYYQSVPSDKFDDFKLGVFKRLTAGSPMLIGDKSVVMPRLIKYVSNAARWEIIDLHRKKRNKEESYKKDEVPFDEGLEFTPANQKDLDWQVLNADQIAEIIEMMDTIGIDKRDQAVYMLGEGINLPGNKGMEPKEILEIYGQELGLKDASKIYSIHRNVGDRIRRHTDRGDTPYLAQLKREVELMEKRDLSDKDKAITNREAEE